MKGGKKTGGTGLCEDMASGALHPILPNLSTTEGEVLALR